MSRGPSREKRREGKDTSDGLFIFSFLFCSVLLKQRFQRMAYKGQSDGGATESSGVTARPHAQAHDAFKCRFLHLQYEDERVHVMAL